jgi:hypothetical protein
MHTLQRTYSALTQACRYPFVATEVLCSELWSIVETCLRNPNQLLAPLWESVLDRSVDDMKTRTVMASHFAKINASFLSKKPAEVSFYLSRRPAAHYATRIDACLYPISATRNRAPAEPHRDTGFRRPPCTSHPARRQRLRRSRGMHAVLL